MSEHPSAAEQEAEVCERLEDRALEDYLAVAGKVLLVHDITAFIEPTDNQQDFHLEPPIRVRVETGQEQGHGLYHWVDEWLDPYWDVEILDEPWKSRLRSAYIFGTSYNWKNGDVQPYEGKLEETQ